MGFSSLEALQAFGMGQQAAKARREEDRARQLREGLISAYDASTGSFDPSKARGAYAQAGDAAGLMQFDKYQGERAKNQLELNTETAEFIGRLAGSAVDEASWQQARSALERYGLKVDHLPAQYDPATVQQLKREALAFSSKGAADPYRFRNNAGDLIELRPDGTHRIAYDDPNDKPNVRWVRADNGDGTFTMVPVGPEGPITGGPGVTPPPGSPQDEAGLRAQAAEAIRQGADPAAVNARLQQMLGGPSRSGSATFP